MAICPQTLFSLSQGSAWEVHNPLCIWVSADTEMNWKCLFRKYRWCKALTFLTYAYQPSFQFCVSSRCKMIISTSLSDVQCVLNNIHNRHKEITNQPPFVSCDINGGCHASAKDKIFWCVYQLAAFWCDPHLKRPVNKFCSRVTYP